MRTESLGDWTIHIPSSGRERRRGLLGRDRLGPCEALRLPRCRSVHTIGMRFPIDVVLLDRAGRALGIRHLPPGRLLLPRRRVREIVEVAAGRGDAFLAAFAEGGATVRR